ncbi:MAG: LexA family transcriptional regulator [Saprospiraceae bacterium]
MRNKVTERFIECHNKLLQENRIRSSRQFAIALGYLPQGITEILKGRRDVTIELLRKMVEVYHVSPTFLFKGEGAMIFDQDHISDLRVLTVVTDSHNDERIVHVPFPAQAGYANEYKDPDFYTELPTYTLPDLRFKSGTHRSFDINGDSMEPVLSEGDKVICSYTDPKYWFTDIKDHHVYVIVTNADIVVKRILNNLSRHRHLELFSDNDIYRPYRVNLADIREIWFVNTKISQFSHSIQHLNQASKNEQIEQALLQQMELIQALKDQMTEHFVK